MDKITEIIPDDIPQWAAEAIERGDFFKVAIAKAEAADKHQTEQAEASNLNDLVINLLGNDEKVDELLNNISGAAIEHNSYEYGLPMYDDGQKEILRKTVLKWIAGL